MYKRIVLLGMPCSGKSSIGRAVAAQMKCRFIDMDQMIEQRTGMTVPELFEKREKQPSGSWRKFLRKAGTDTECGDLHRRRDCYATRKY